MNTHFALESTNSLNNEAFFTSWRRLAMRAPMITLLLGAFAFAVWLVPGSGEYLQYERAAMCGGQFWRLVTGHFTHYDNDQFIWNFLPFMALGALCEQRGRKEMAICVGVSVLAIPIVLWLAMPGLGSYRGLSGLDTALFSLIGVWLIRDKMAERQWGGVVCVGLLWVGLVVKIIYEYYAGANLFVANTGEMVPIALAHIVGQRSGRWLARRDS